MSKYVNWKAKIQTLVLDIVILYSFNFNSENDHPSVKNSIIYWWNSMTTVIFHDFPGLENSFLKFHDFQGCIRTLNEK